MRKVRVPKPKSDGRSQFQRPIVANVAAVINAMGKSTNKNLNLRIMMFVFFVLYENVYRHLFEHAIVSAAYIQVDAPLGKLL